MMLRDRSTLLARTLSCGVLLSLCSWRRARAVVAVALVTATVGISQMQTPTLKSIPTPPSALTGGEFESTAVTTFAYAPTWAPWTMTPLTVVPPNVSGSGIARKGSTLLAQSDDPPGGRCAMFIEGLGVSSCDVPLTPGLWRVRFKAAQRRQGADPDVQRLRVTFGGATVFERQFEAAEFDEYATQPIRVATSGAIPLVFSGLVGTGSDNIALVDSIFVEQVLDWSLASSWIDVATHTGASQPPTLTDNVFIAPGSTVALTGASLAETVEVQGALTVEAVNCSLASEWLLIHSTGARFDVGSAEVPFADDFVLTLRGLPNGGGPTIQDAGTKFLVAMDGGHIEMHGLPKKSWSRLTSIVDDTIEVTDHTGWEVGDQIVLVTTTTMSLIDGEKASESEVCTIDDITSGILTLSLAPDDTKHCTEPPMQYQAPNGPSWTIDQRAEVGMLSHNVRVEGDANDSTPVQGFGAHVMMMNGECCATPGTGCFSHVQFRRMGQRAALGRYPLHWHMQLEAGAGQYARGCSVWESFNRALTVHGTDFLAVEDNVFFDHYGHGVFLEDGGEQYNRIEGNLAVLTRRPEAAHATLPHDYLHDEAQNRSPAAFWISNPNNDFIGNVAAHTVGTGYWFAVHTHPTGQSFGNDYFDVAPGQPMNPTQLPLGAFDDNTAHSCKSGLDVNDTVDDGGTPALPENDKIKRNVSWDPPGGAVLNRFSAWGCSMGIYAGTGTDSKYTDLVTFNDSVLADNERHMQLACAFIVADSLLVENTDSGVFDPNPVAGHFFPEMFPPPGYAYTVYDGPGQLVSSHIVGFDGGQDPSATLVNISAAARRHANHVLQDLTFAPGTTARVLFPDFTTVTDPLTFEPTYWGVAIRGLSSALSGGLHGDRTLITNHPMMHLTDGPSSPDYPVPLPSQNVWLSPYEWGYLELFHYRKQVNTPDGWQLLGGNSLPQTTFTRGMFNTWPGATFKSTAIDPNNLLRQLPIIVRPVSTPSAPECLYTIGLEHPSDGNYGDRVDVVVDDRSTGDVARLQLSNDPQNAWNQPNVYLNDLDSDNPSDWIALTPVSVPNLDSQTRTAFARPNNETILLRTVNPRRRHQVTITW